MKKWDVGCKWQVLVAILIEKYTSMFFSALRISWLNSLATAGVELRKTQHFYNYSKSTKARRFKFCTVLTLVLETSYLKSQSCISELYLNLMSRYNINCVRKISFTFGVQFRGKRGGKTRCVLWIMGWDYALRNSSPV